MQRFLLLLTLSIPLLAKTQNSDVQISQRMEDNVLILSAENSSKQDLDLDLTLKTRGFGRMPSEKIAAFLPAGATVELIRLQATPGKKQSYSTEYRYTPRASPVAKAVAKPAPPQAPTPAAPAAPPSVAAPDTDPANRPEVTEAKGMVVYTKQGCPRCAATIKFLDENQIEYRELDADTYGQEMFGLLRENGLKGQRVQVQMPVVRIDEAVHYNIKDLNGFLESLKSR